MIQKLKAAIFSLMSVMAFAIPVLVPATVSAAVSQGGINNQLCSGTNGDLTGNSTDCTTGASDSSFNSAVRTIINILSVIVGIVAVIMIIIGGFRYITSGGKQESVTGAKNTILYALIGLVIVALAQIIVHFVINKVQTNVTGA